MKFRVVITSFFILLLLSVEVEARVYYSRATGNWSNSSSWSTVAYGNATNTGTFPTSIDTAYIGNGVTIYINVSSSVYSLTVGNGVSGVLEYLSSVTSTFTVSNNLLINTGAFFYYNSSSASGRTQICNIAGNFTNYGNVDFNYDANDFVNTVFNGSVNSIVSGTGTFNMKTVTINKASPSNSVEVTAINFESSITSFVGTSGNYTHNNSSTYSLNPTTSFQIVPNLTITVSAGTVAFASSATTLNLQGALVINGGAVTVGPAPGTQGIRTDQGASTPVIASITITSGSLTVYGGITFRTGSGSKPFIFTMTGGTVLLNSGSTGTTTELFKITDVTSSVFTMSGGTIVFQKPNGAGGTSIDLDICGALGTVNVTDGIMQFGNVSTAANASFNFKPYSAATYPHIVIKGPTSNGTTLSTSAGSNNSAPFQLLSLRIEQGSTFDNRSFSPANGDSKFMYLVGSSTGNVAFYNDGTFNPRTGTVVFNGTSDQIIDGAGTLSFYDFEINNPTTVSLSKNITITNSLILTSGIINSVSSAYPILSAGAACPIGSSTAYISGPMMYQVAAFNVTILNFPVGGGGVWRPNQLVVTHSSTAAVNYYCQMVNSPAASLSFTLPGTLSRVSYVRYYQFVRSGAANFTSATIKIYYGSDDGVTDFTTLRVAQGDGANWVNLSGIGSGNNSGTITSSSFLTFTNIYSLANSTGGSNPLPIELMVFNAKRNENVVDLSWTTASELNNDRFEILRSSNGIEFYQIGAVAGAGTYSQLSNYFYIDEYPVSGTNFYKLRQVDIDGRYTESPVRLVTFKDYNFQIYPTVSTGADIKVQFSSEFADAYLTVISSEGKVVLNQPIEQLANDGLIPVIPAGTYQAIVTSGDQRFFKSLIVIN